MKFNKMDIKPIMMGVIASLLVYYFFDPILKFFGNIIFKVTSIFFEKYNDMLFQRIALRNFNIDMYIYFYIFMLFFIIFTAIIMKFYFDHKNILKDFSDLEKKVCRNEMETIDTTVNIEEINDIKDMIELRKKEIKKEYFRSNIQSSIMFLVFLILGSINLSTEITIKNKVELYENSLRIISPYISDHEKNIFESRFVQIKNKNDFELLKEQMNNILIDHGLKIIWQ